MPSETARIAQIAANLAANYYGQPTTELTWHDVAAVLSQSDLGLNPATRTRYRSAVRAIAHQQPEPERDAIIATLEDAKHPAAANGDQHRRHSKKKQLPPGDLGTLLSALRERGRTSWYAQPCRWFLLAGLYTGLRPIEWTQARIATHPDHDHSDLPHAGLDASTSAFTTDQTLPPNTRILIVPNAKEANAPADRPRHRVLDITDLGQWRQQIITRLVLLNHEAARTGYHHQLYHGCTRLLRRVNGHLWPRRSRHITLTTPRHQARAAFEETYDPDTVAYLMGHGSTSTRHHYGRYATHAPAVPLPVPALHANLQSLEHI